VSTSRTEHRGWCSTRAGSSSARDSEVTYLKPGADGIVETDQVEAGLRSDTILVSLIAREQRDRRRPGRRRGGRAVSVARRAVPRGCAQSAGKLPIDVGGDCIDCSPLTAHKVHGPKGVGALCMRREPRLGLVPLLHGGGQDGACAPAPCHAPVVGLGAAFRIAGRERATMPAQSSRLRERLWHGLSALPEVMLTVTRHGACRGS